MVAPTASDAPRLVPADRPRVAVAADGTLAAVAEASRVTVLELPSAAPFAEIGLAPGAAANELVWVGAPPRLLVLSRFAAHSTAYLIDPYGPRSLAEIRLESPMKLHAAVGAHALAVGAPGAAVLTATETHLTPYQFPARVVPTTVGTAGNNFVVALTGAIEEWDPQSRMPKRRLRLPRPSVITALGGSERVVWMTTQHDPRRIDVIPLVNRGQPKHHELPEPIAHVTGHPRSDLVVCVGADSGRSYVVDLDGRDRLRTVALEGIERTEAAALVVGRMVGVIAGQALRPIEIVRLDGRAHEADGGSAPTPAAPLLSSADVPRARATLFEAVPVVPPAASPAASTGATGAPATEPAAAPAIPADVAARAARDLGARVGGWAKRLFEDAPRIGDDVVRWRDEVAAWARAMMTAAADRAAPAASSIAPPTAPANAPPTAPAIAAVAERFELPAEVVPALVLLYGAHLCGERGAAPVDVARVLGRRWDEALGTGELARRGLATYDDSRVRLATEVRRALDELPPATGILVGEPGVIALLGPCVVVAEDASLAALAERHVATVGTAILVAHAGAELGALAFEARVRGAVPMLRVPAGDHVQHGSEPLILVVSDEAHADALGLPRL